MYRAKVFTLFLFVDFNQRGIDMTTFNLDAITFMIIVFRFCHRERLKSFSLWKGSPT